MIQDLLNRFKKKENISEGMDTTLPEEAFTRIKARMMDVEHMKPRQSFNTCIRKLRPKQMKSTRQRVKAVGTARILLNEFGVDSKKVGDRFIAEALDKFIGRYSVHDRSGMDKQIMVSKIMGYLVTEQRDADE